ncbi:MAG: hypothetical protein K2Y22_14390 [Candidatus Obscuribacterales bacterium]|nr:hypothetical protein [Candidatus Obscuribacterales bacterium]
MTEQKQRTLKELNEREQQILPRIYEIQAEQEKLNKEYCELYTELMTIHQERARAVNQPKEEVDQ